jgi:hypothetical protein
MASRLRHDQRLWNGYLHKQGQAWYQVLCEQTEKLHHPSFERPKVQINPNTASVNLKEEIAAGLELENYSISSRKLASQVKQEIKGELLMYDQWLATLRTHLTIAKISPPLTLATGTTQTTYLVRD